MPFQITRRGAGVDLAPVCKSTPASGALPHRGGHTSIIDVRRMPRQWQFEDQEKSWPVKYFRPLSTCSVTTR